MSDGSLWLAGLDPGRSKCGLVLALPEQRRILASAVLTPEACLEQVRLWRLQGLRRVLLGDGTRSREWREALRELDLSVQLVDERGSTLAARQRYWDLHPPRGWRRLLPRGLRLPPRDIDDVVAQLLLERELGWPLRTEPEP